MKVATSYFYQIRNFKPNMIPVSTAMSDPAWFRPPQGKQWYIDKRGIVCGLRYEPLIVQPLGTPDEYRQLLETVDFEKLVKAFDYCSNKFRPLPFDDGVNDPIIVLMVYEAPNNDFSERSALQDYFTSHGYECKELEYPIK